MSFVVVVLLLHLISYSHAQKLKPGDPAPDLNAFRIDNRNYPDTGLEEKVIVLEFWFVSCGPCIYSIPHMNELSEQYDQSEVAFVAVTFDDSTRIRQFLDKKDYKAMILSDTSRRIIKSYEVGSYPTAFLIDAEGRIRWKGSPLSLTSDMIDMVIGSARYNQIIGTKISEDLPAAEVREEQYSFELNENTYSEGSGYSINRKEISFANYSLIDFYSIVYRLSKARIIMPEELGSQRYDIRLKPYKDSSVNSSTHLLGITAQHVDNELKVSEEWVDQSVESYKIAIGDMDRFIANAIDTTRTYQGSGTTITNDGYWIGTGVTMEELAIHMERQLGKVFIDQSQLKAVLEFTFPITDVDKAIDFLTEKYGLEFTRSMEPVRMLRVSRN